MSNAQHPTPQMDNLARRIARRFGIPWSGSGAVSKTAKGYRSQLIYRSNVGGNHFNHVHFGIRKMRRGGIVGVPGFRRGTKGVGRVRGRRHRARKPPSLRRLVRGLAGRPGNRGAERLTRRLSGRVGGRSTGALLRARNDIQARIRRLSRLKRGETNVSGPARIKIRRLRGALSLIEDELGRPIGGALGASDAAQDWISRSLGNLDNELIVAGADPESAAGRQQKIGRTRSAIGALTTRRAGLAGALTRAQATGNRTAVGQVQTEINEVDDQILGLRADLTTLSQATTDAAADQAAAARELAESNRELSAEVKRQNDFADSVANITAREALRFMVDRMSEAQGQDYSARRRNAGDGKTLMRLP